MANKITTYKKIKTARDTLKTLAAEMQSAVNGLPSTSYKTKGGSVLSTHAANVAKVFNSAEGNLTEAHKAANALGSVKSRPKAATISYKISKCSGNSEIYISDSDALSSANALGSCITKLKSLKTDIQTCYNEINSVNITEQLISSLTIIDFLFPLSGMTKAAQILFVKNVGTTNLKQAKSDVTKIITYSETLKKEVISSVNDFVSCEEKVKRRTYDDLLNTTNNMTESSNTPQKDIKDSIAALEAKQKEYVALYGAECQAIKDEIARLKNLLKKMYVGDYAAVIEAAIKNEVGNGGAKYKQWFYDNYGGLSPTQNYGWCDRFVSWLLGQMGYKMKEGGCSAQLKSFSNKGGYHNASGYTPSTGDVVFFDWNNDGSPDHVGIIYIDEKGEQYVIHGNFSNKVCYTRVSDALKWNGGQVLGYGLPSCLDKL